MRTPPILLLTLACVTVALPARAQEDVLAPIDRDGDGVADEIDKCPDDPEDDDDFERHDGCPDDDDDGDGVPDAIDKCGRDPETRNQYEDDDGCPDALPAGRIDVQGCQDGKACKAAGDAAWNVGDQATAAGAYAKACALGDVGACGSYGVMLEGGKGVTRSLPSAASIYRFACARRVSAACYNLGLMTRDGRGLRANPPRAATYIGQACDLGLPQACTTLGRPLPSAPAAPTPSAPATPTAPADCADAKACDDASWAAFGAKRFDDAARLGQKACDLGKARGCALMSHLLDQGKGVGRDLVKSLSYARKGCAGGDQSACHNVAFRLAAGDVVAQDLAEARRLYEAACTSGLKPSCDQLAKLPKPDVMAPVLAAFDGKDFRGAVKLAKPLCDGGNMEACGVMGTARWELGAKKDAMTLWQKACDGGEGWACGELASIHWEGDGVRADRARALALAKLGCERRDPAACRSAGGWTYSVGEANGVTWFVRACDMSDLEGCASAAHSYRDGDFGPKDAIEAVRFGRRACDLGSMRECALVGAAECDGRGTARDTAACKRHLQQACTGGDELACEDLHDRFD